MNKNLFSTRFLVLILLPLGCIYSCSSSSSGGDTSVGSDKAILEFSFTTAKNPILSSDSTSSISGTEITVTLPYGGDTSNLQHLPFCGKQFSSKMDKELKHEKILRIQRREISQILGN